MAGADGSEQQLVPLTVGEVISVTRIKPTTEPVPPLTAREFIKSQPLDVPVKEMVARAAALGVTVARPTISAERWRIRNGYMPESGSKLGRPAGRVSTKAQAKRGKGGKRSDTAAFVDFVRRVPYDLQADEVNALARKAGLSPRVRSRVYKIRHDHKPLPPRAIAATTTTTKERPPMTPRIINVGAPDLPRVDATPTEANALEKAEGVLRAIVLQIGTARAGQIVKQLETMMEAWRQV